MGALGDALIDGANPVVKYSTVLADGSVVDDGDSNPVSGYSLVGATGLNSALAKAKGYPIRQSGGSIEVAEAFGM